MRYHNIVLGVVLYKVTIVVIVYNSMSISRTTNKVHRHQLVDSYTQNVAKALFVKEKKCNL